MFGVFIQLKIGNALYAQKLFGYVLYGFSGIELVYFEHICFVSIQGCFKNFVKRCVFKCFLKVQRDWMLRSEMGREFQTVGPETVKDLYPHDLRENLGRERS